MIMCAMDYFSELPLDVITHILVNLELSDLDTMLDLYFKDEDKSNIFKSLVIYEFNTIPSKIYDWETVYTLWIKHGRFFMVYTDTYEEDCDFLQDALENESNSIELIKFITYENIAKYFYHVDVWYSLIILNVIDIDYNDINLFMYIISKLHGNLYEEIKDILRFYTRDHWYETPPISYDMLSLVLDYMGKEYTREFIKDVIECSPSSQYPEYMKLIKFLETYSDEHNIKWY